MTAIGLLTGAPLTLASCGLGESGARSGTEDGPDRQSAELATAPQFQDDAVCSTGRWNCRARVRTQTNHAVMAFATPAGYGPADLASAYRLDPARHRAATIAIVDAFHYPNAESDLAVYRSQFGLAPCTQANGCLTIVNQNGATSPLPASPPVGDDWNLEAALDLDMASAACPTCRIVLVEANDDASNGLFVAQNAAAALPGVVAISDSWGGPSQGDDVSRDSLYFSHANVSTFVASGDSGYTGSSPDYPSTSAHVTAVGGTSLTRSSTARGWTEVAWDGAGSSCSQLIAKPSFQTNPACANRAAADVSAVADPATGVAVYDAVDGGWITVGGTSAASPFVAAVYARYGLGGRGPDYSYGRPGEFFDVTSGSNGSCGNALCLAGSGWDGPTGNGSPNGGALAPRDSDILWRDSDGTVAIWLMNGGAIGSQVFPGKPGLDWTIQGVGDFNGDDASDILWRDSDGTVAIWLMNGGTITSQVFPTPPGGDWTIQGVGDFNHDGMSDILWRDTDGTVAIWFMNGGTITSQAFPGQPGLDWKIQGVGDFNGDGMSDILWRDSDGSVAIWLMNGGTIATQAFPGKPGLDWTIQSTGDFNHDGMSDILWRDSDGTVAIWFMNGGTIATQAFPGSATLDWTIQGTGDFNGDGMSDILWRNANGTVGIWFMNGGTITTQAFPGQPGLDWVIHGTGNFD